MDITVKKDEIMQIGKEVIDYSSALDDLIKQFIGVIDQINVAWEGEDALKYINILKTKYVPGLEALKMRIEEYGTYLKDVPEAYTILDQDFASQFIDV